MIGQWLDPNISERKFNRFKSSFENFRVGKHQLIIPDISEAHFNVIDISIDNNSPDFVTAITYYESLYNNKNLNSNVFQFVTRMVHVFNKYILSKSEACQPESILQLIGSSHCLQQQNVIDCGLLAIMACFHILEGKKVDESIFEQEHITELQCILPSLLNQKKNDNSRKLC